MANRSTSKKELAWKDALEGGSSTFRKFENVRKSMHDFILLKLSMLRPMPVFQQVFARLRRTGSQIGISSVKNVLGLVERNWCSLPGSD